METSIQAAVTSQVISVVRRVVRKKELGISEKTSLVADLRFGRLARARLALHLEDAFGLELPDDVVAGFQSVADIVRYFSHRYFRNAEFHTAHALLSSQLARSGANLRSSHT